MVPCTSQPARRDASGNLYPEYLEGTSTDGFAKTTTVMLNEARFIDKTRITGELGTVSTTFYNTIYNSIFNTLFESKAFSLDKLQGDFSNLKNDFEKVQKERDRLEKELNDLVIEHAKLKEILLEQSTNKSK
ncbi:hypothetical protein N752_29880 [Desulforamulus aquiferis]|nr:hypothetical protein N752_29880 [Desulforamulus aquiferis]